MKRACALLLAGGLALALPAAPASGAAYGCQAKVVLGAASRAETNEDAATSAAVTLLTPLASGAASADLLARLLAAEVSAARGAEPPLASGARVTDTFTALGPDAGAVAILLLPRTRLPLGAPAGSARLAWSAEIASGDVVLYHRSVTQEPGLPPVTTGDVAPFPVVPGTPYRLTITLDAEITTEVYADASLSYWLESDASLHVASASGAALPAAGGSWGGVKALYR